MRLLGLSMLACSFVVFGGERQEAMVHLAPDVVLSESFLAQMQTQEKTRDEDSYLESGEVPEEPHLGALEKESPYISGIAHLIQNFYAVSTGDLLFVMDMETGKDVKLLFDASRKKDAWITSIAAFSFQGKVYLVSGSRDGNGRIWNPATGECIQRLPEKKRNGVDSLSTFTHEGKPYVAAGYYDGMIRIWDPMKGECIACLRGHTGRVTALASGALENGALPYLVSGSYDDTVRVWEPFTGACTQILLGHQGFITAVTAISYQETVYAISAGSYDRTLCMWDISTGELVKKWMGHTSAIYQVDSFLHEDEVYIVSAGSVGKDRGVHVWKWSRNTQRRWWQMKFTTSSVSLAMKLPPPKSWVSSFASVKRGQERYLLVNSQDGVSTLWKLGSKKMVSTRSPFFHFNLKKKCLSTQQSSQNELEL